MLSRLEQQELAKQKEREFEELRKTWAISSEKRGGGGTKKKKQSAKRDSENEAEPVPGDESYRRNESILSDSESEVKQSDEEADVFGSSSEDDDSNTPKTKIPLPSTTGDVELFDSDEDVPKQSSGNLRKKRPAGELEDDDQDEAMFTTKEEEGGTQKQRRVLDDDEGEAEADF